VRSGSGPRGDPDVIPGQGCDINSLSKIMTKTVKNGTEPELAMHCALRNLQVPI
jgi:hypothetical protein